MPPPITTTSRPIGSTDLSSACRRSAMKSTASRTCDLSSPSVAQRVDARPGRCRGTPRHGPARKRVQRQVAPQRLAVLDRDAADLQQPVDLGLREVAGRLVGGDAVFVQPAGLGPRVVEHHVMPVHRQPVRAGQSRRPRPHHRHPLARRRRAGEGMHALRHQRVGGKALQPPDLHRLALGRLAHAGLFAQLSRSGRPGRTCRPGCSGPRSSAPPPRACRSRSGG